MNSSLFHKRIPTILALFILVAGLITTAILVQKGVFTTSQATPNETPQNIQITNITNDSFTVTFTTLDPTIAAVNVENTNPPRVVYDVRSPDGSKAFLSHFITVSNLNPANKYSFTVLSHGKVFQENGKSFTITTATSNTSFDNSFALSGSIILPDGNPGIDVLVQAVIPNAAPVAAITDSNGNYTIPSGLIRNLSHDQIVTLVPDTQIYLTATQGNIESKISYQYQPGVKIPTISLSQNYSFIAGQREKTGTQSSLLTVPKGNTQPPQIKITTPKTNQTFTDVRPEFRGSALPNTLITITIHSDPITVQIRSDPNGNWAYRPAVALSAGIHTITIQAPDINGVMKTITNSFTVFASGSQIAESATPSATPTITSTPTPTLAPSIVPSPSATPTPTSVVLPSPTPSLTPTPTPTVTAQIPTRSPNPPVVPPTGDTSQAIFLTMISIVFIVSGSALLFIL